jgi:hypothetical protein
MFLRSLAGAIRRKFLIALLGENIWSVIDTIRKLGHWYLIQRYAPESKYPELLESWYFESTGKKLDLRRPRTFNEKIQWLKLYENTPLKTRLSDKYLVRRWIAEKIGAQYLVPLLGVWDNFDEIDFDALPNQFVLKANHGCGWMVIVKDKSRFDRAAAKVRFDLWMNANFAYCAGLELQYRDIEPKIIAEQYLKDESGALADYKLYCFDGKPYCIGYFCDRFRKGGYKVIIYDLDWNPAGWTLYADHAVPGPVKKPANLDEMIRIAAVLCAGFCHVRVDFFSVNGKLFVGEMTFTTNSGINHFSSEEWNRKLGDMIKLPAAMPIAEK